MVDIRAGAVGDVADIEDAVVVAIWSLYQPFEGGQVEQRVIQHIRTNIVEVPSKRELERSIYIWF